MAVQVFLDDAGTLPISLKFWHSPPWQRSTLKPVSVLELSVHERTMLLEEFAAAVRLEGAEGTGSAARVVAMASFEYSELPSELNARTLYL